jgi:hypothetical protein
MRVLNAVRRVLLLLVLIPVVAICLDALLLILGARRGNPIVAGVRDFAQVFILEPFRTVFRNQSPYQDAAVALVAYGLLALLIVFLFRGLAAMVGSRPPRAQPAPAAKPAPKPAPAATPAAEQTKTTDDTSTASTTADGGTTQTSKS